MPHQPMTLRLNDTDHAKLREKARAEGISMQEAARRAVRRYTEEPTEHG